MELSTFIKKLKEIEKKGYIKTLRRGATGVGHTLEQSLDLKENNLKVPDLGEFELKAIRKHATNPITLFTKEPITFRGSAAKYLVENFGYNTPRDGSIKELYITISYEKYNSQNFKLEVDEKNKTLFIKKKSEEISQVFWTHEMLENVANKKIKSLILVLANSRNDGFDEEFHYDEAYLLEGFDFHKFLEAIKHGYIKVDLRMHIKKNGSIRNHGTAFRIQQNKLMEIYKTRKRLL